MTFVEKLTLVSSFAALISAAAALFASIAQVFIARSSNLYAYRLESDKLFFHAKVEAYQQFFQATDRCMNLLDRTSAGDLLARCSYAILFSEEDATCKKLSALSALLMEFRSSPASTNVLENSRLLSMKPSRLCGRNCYSCVNPGTSHSQSTSTVYK